MSGNTSTAGEERLAAQIQEIGFSCIRCGECCAGLAEDNNLVMVSPPEIRRISAYCHLSQEEIAEPYPESVTLADGTILTFGWALRRIAGDCRFFQEGSCQVYACRPWICRTYPFMLDGEELLVFPCRGLGGCISQEDARALARDLLHRRDAEHEEEEKVRRALSCPLPGEEKRLIVDSEGVKVL